MDYAKYPPHMELNVQPTTMAEQCSVHRLPVEHLHDGLLVIHPRFPQKSREKVPTPLTDTFSPW